MKLEGGCYCAQVLYTIDRQPFHQIPEGLPTFERLPQR